jgi:hypothetical protein
MRIGVAERGGLPSADLLGLESVNTILSIYTYNMHPGYIHPASIYPSSILNAIIYVSRHEHVFALLRGLPDTPDWHLCVKLIKQQSPSILGRPAKVIESLQDTENELLERKGLGPDALLFTKGKDRQLRGRKEGR